MAGSIASLSVSLGLDAAAFVSGLTASERQAKRFAKTLESDVGGAVSFLKAALGGITVGSLVVAFDRAIEGAAKFKQLSEEIGDTAEAIGGLQTAANTSGVAINDIAAASVKLTSALSKTDDESSQAAKAIKALGLNLAEFKALSPVAQVESFAKALASFEDGAGKTAVAVAAFGKTGAQLIPFFNDLAEAGGRNVRLTQEQIESADRFAKQMGALKGEIALVAQGIAVDMVPAISEMIREMTTGIQIAGGFVSALRLFGTINLGRLPKELALINVQIEELQKQKTSGGLFSDFNNRFVDSRLADLEKQKLFIREITKQQALALIDPSNADQNDRRNRRPTLVANLGGDDKKAVAALKERETEAERYLKSLEKQLEKTQELTVAEQLWLDFSNNRIKGMSAAQFAEADAFARRIDQAHELKKAQEGQQRQEQEAARIRERISQDSTRAAELAQKETDSIIAHNQALADDIAIIKGGEEAIRAIERARIDSAIATKKDTLAALENLEGTERQAEQLRTQITLLGKAKDLIAAKTAAEALAAEAKNTLDVANQFSDSFANSFDGFIAGTKSAKDALRSFADDIEAMLRRAALRKVSDFLFGGNTATQSPDVFSVIAKLFGAWAGGGSGLTSTGGGFGEHFAMGGTSRGGLALVGERGPEILNLPRGAQVIPITSAMKGGGATYQNTFHVNVMPGATTASVRQTRDMLRHELMRSVRDR